MNLTQALLRKEKEFESGFKLPAGAAIWVDENMGVAYFYGTPEKGWTANVFAINPNEYRILVRAKTQERTTAEVR